MYASLTYNTEDNDGEVEDIPRFGKIMQTLSYNPDNCFQGKYGCKY